MFCAVKLQFGVNKCNLLSLYLFQFILSMVLQVQITLLSYLVYEISPGSNSGKVVGNLGFYADITVVLLDLVLGLMMDFFGRKALSLCGFIIAGTAQIVMPLCLRIYPGMLICRILIAVGLLPALNTPLVLDYVQQESLGMASAQINMISLFAQLLSTSGAIFISERIPIRSIFYASGTVTLLSTCILLFGLKEVHYKRKMSHFQSVHTASVLSENNRLQNADYVQLTRADTMGSIRIDESGEIRKGNKRRQCMKITK